MTWVYDKDNMMWRRDLNVRVIFSPLRGWIAVHSMKGRLPQDFIDADEGKRAADHVWPVDPYTRPSPADGTTYIWPPPPKKQR